MFTGLPRASGVERYILLLNIIEVPDDIQQQCDILIQRAHNCTSQRTGCSRRVEESYDRRFYDGAYVMYLLDLGVHVCGHLSQLLDLKNCFTPELQESVQSCINPQYDIQCLLDQYDHKNNCPTNTDDYFHSLVNWLANNPYLGAGPDRD